MLFLYINVIFSDLEEKWTAEFCRRVYCDTVLRTAVNLPEV